MSFGRLPGTRSPRAIGDINVTPLVDVVLVLLVIFIVAAPLMARQMALELPSAKAATPAPAAAPVVTLELDTRSGLRGADEREHPAVGHGRVGAQAAGLRRVGFTARQPASPR
jgi:biopolymer transport protein ExbD